MSDRSRHISSHRGRARSQCQRRPSVGQDDRILVEILARNVELVVIEGDRGNGRAIGADRLQQVLRSQKALTYGASADLDTYKYAGAVIAETDTQTANTAEALRVTIDEFTRLQRERVNDGELEAAQDYMVGHFPLTIEVPDQIATQVLNQLFYELPVEELPRYRERILKVTPDEIQRVARWFIRPSQLSVVLVGDADKFIKDLKGVGFGTVERIPIEQLDLLSADFLKHPGTGRPE